MITGSGYLGFLMPDLCNAWRKIVIRSGQGPSSDVLPHLHRSELRVFPFTIYAKTPKKPAKLVSAWGQAIFQSFLYLFCGAACCSYTRGGRKKRTRRDEVSLVLGVLEPLEEARGETQGGRVPLA